MKKKYLALFLLFIVPYLFIWSCDSKTEYHLISAIDLSPVLHPAVDSNGRLAYEDTDTSGLYQANEVGWLLVIHYGILSSVPRFQFVPAAYASKQIRSVALEQLQDIKVFTIHDYNSRYLAGDEISSIFLLEDDRPLSSIIESWNKSDLPFAPNLLGHLADAPSDTALVQMRVEFIFENQSTVSTLSAPVKIY